MKVECFRFAKPGSKHTNGGPFYVYARRGERGWNATAMSGINEAWSNFADDAELMRLDMDRCASAELASEAFLRHARRGYTVEVV
jgi:hypothetical protein